MITHARRAVPWTLVLVSAALIAAMMAIVGRWPGTTWPLQGTAVGLLAATCGRCLDEPSPELTDTTPRTLRWRVEAQGLGVVALLAAWVTSVLALGGDLLGHRSDVLAQGVAATTATLGAVAWLRSRGVPAPGRALATWIVAVLTGVALVRPAPAALPLFPYPPEETWADSRILWAGAAAAGLLALGAALSDVTWRQPTPAAPSHARRF